MLQGMPLTGEYLKNTDESGLVLRQAGGRVVSVSEGMNLRELGGWSLHRLKIGFVGILHLSTDMCFHICSIRRFLHIL